MVHRNKAVYLGAALMALAVSGCTMERPKTASDAAAPMDAKPMAEKPSAVAEAPGTAHPELWPTGNWPTSRNPAVEARIAALISNMTIEEKVGQVVQADIGSVTPAEAKEYHLGSILNGGNSAPGNDEYAPAQKWLELADSFYDASVDKSDGRIAIPILWGTDAVHGHSNIVGATLFPHNVGLGAANDVDLIGRIAKATALEIRTTGMEWTFAPTVTVPQDIRWGRAYEGYSEDPKLVASYVGRFIRGLQGEPGGGPLLKGPYVMASTKHFLADGGTEEGRDQGDAKISEAELRDIHGLPYVEAINAGVQTIMVSFSSWNGKKMTGNKSLLTGVLKERMRYDGFIISDWNAHGQVEGCTNSSCPQAINAGLDMYMAPDTWKPLYKSLVTQAKDGTIPMARLDDAVGNILRVKINAGLFEAGRPSSRPYAGKYEILGSPEHRALAREAVRKSLVLLKNDTGVLPLRPQSNILVAGDGADDIGKQSGGWTLTWQGTGFGNDKLPGATSLWAGINQAVKAAGGSATLSPDGSFTKRPDSAIVIFGETPYAEFQGDLKNAMLKPENAGPLATMKKLKAQGIPVVAVFISGRPMFVNPALNASDAFVAAWLPGSEGGGLSDVLFRKKDGSIQHDFTGKLSFSWPMTADVKGSKLFPLGYGQSYAAPKKLGKISEESGIAEDSISTDLYFKNGSPSASWSLQVSSPEAGITRITSTPVAAAAGRVQVTAVDHEIQEGARRFVWRGDGPASVELATQAPINIDRESNADILVLMTVRIDGKPTAPVRLSTTCGSNCGSEIVTDQFANLPLGQWKTVAVPLKCLANRGTDMKKVDVPIRLTTSGKFDMSLSKVALGTVSDMVISCK
jgi:beta-glucosidase